MSIKISPLTFPSPLSFRLLTCTAARWSYGVSTFPFRLHGLYVIYRGCAAHAVEALTRAAMCQAAVGG